MILKNMGEFLSLLELNEPDEKDKLKSNFFANTSVLMRIYKKKLSFLLLILEILQQKQQTT